MYTSLATTLQPHLCIFMVMWNFIVWKQLFLYNCIIISASSVSAKRDLSIFFEHVSPRFHIVGGTPSDPGSAPYMVALSLGGTVKSFFCGGSLITTETILTAGHCVEAVHFGGRLIPSLHGTVGTNHWMRGGVTFGFRGNVTHPQYSHDEIKNDLGMLIAAAPIHLTNLIQPVPLSYDLIGENVPVKATGWGKTRANSSPHSEVLIDLYTSTIQSSTCVVDVQKTAMDLGIYAPPVDPEHEICTFHSPGHGMCNGDSGSALLRRDSLRQVGIVSWGFPCAIGAPDMYTRVSAYRDFIEDGKKYHADRY